MEGQAEPCTLEALTKPSRLVQPQLPCWSTGNSFADQWGKNKVSFRLTPGG